MKFEQTDYYKIWATTTEGRTITSMILNNPDMIRANYTFWKSKFKVDPEITPTNSKGEAIFVSYMRQPDSGVMMDMRAPLSDTIATDEKGMEAYSGSIPEYSARGFVEKATERMYKEKFFDQFGDARLLAQWTTDHLQRMMNAGNQTLSNQAAELLSTGKIIYKYGEGLKGNILKAEIPAENFKKAGKLAWTDPSCRLLDQMRKIEQDAKEAWGVDFSMQWEITRDMFLSLFLTNEQVIEWVRYTNLINNTPLPATMEMTFDMVRTAVAKFEGLSPIVIIEEKQKDITSGIVHGWKDGVAVLRPSGYAGFMRRAAILDEEVYKKYANGVNSYNFTPALDGLGTVMNSVIVNGNFKEWHTDFLLKAVPTLDEFLYHIIVDTQSADE